MEKKTYDLCAEVLRRLDKAGILKSIILIGSWSIYFYKYYFKSDSYSTAIRTTDIDFLVPIPNKFDKNINLHELVEDLGYEKRFINSKGYIKLLHPDLTIEFLAPERGRGSDKPYKLPELRINAQALRYLDLLADNTIVVNFEGIQIRLPHPAAYALHKFIIFKRRKGEDKHDRDIEGAMRVFRELINSNQHKDIKKIFNKMHKKWQKTILANLESAEIYEAIDVLTQQ